MNKNDDSVTLYESDIKRYDGDLDRWTRSFLKAFRQVSVHYNGIRGLYFRLKYRKICGSHGIEIPRVVEIGKGLYLGHPYNITINPHAVIGENVNIHKGVTIGQENRGERKGAPQIGNRVWIGVNSTIVGKITIGNNVLIAPNTYINRDVPSNSIVFGNPCIIKHNDKATEGYINHSV